MFKTLGAALVAAALSWAGSAQALISFTSIGNDPVIARDFTPLAGNRPGSFGIETLTPANQVNVLVSFDREPWMTHKKFNYLDDFVALGPLQGVLSLHGDPATWGSNGFSLVIGELRITYAGPDVTVHGKTYSAGDTLAYTRFNQSDPYGPYVVSQFVDTGTGVSRAFVQYLNPVTDGYVISSGLSGYVPFGVPEPSTWAMLIIGFGLAGSELRRRRFATAV